MDGELRRMKHTSLFSSTQLANLHLSTRKWQQTYLPDASNPARTQQFILFLSWSRGLVSYAEELDILLILVVFSFFQSHSCVSDVHFLFPSYSSSSSGGHRRTAAPTHRLCDSTTAWKQPADQLFIPHCNRTDRDDRRRCRTDLCCSTNSSRKIQPFQSVFSYAMQRSLCTLWNVEIWGVCRNMVIQTTSTRNSHHFWPVDHLFDNPFPWKEVKFQWPLTIKI